MKHLLLIFSRKLQITFTVSCLALAAFSPVSTQAQTIHRRLLTQQERIGNDVFNGTLAPGEAARLETREVDLRDPFKADRRAQGGTLTAVERTRIQAEFDRLSGRIHAAKHDGPGN